MTTALTVYSINGVTPVVDPNIAEDASPQQAAAQPAAEAQVAQPTLESIACASTDGQRNHCAADTSAGVALLRSTGSGTCLLGKSWGYDDKSVWVSDGCSGEAGAW